MVKLLALIFGYFGWAIFLVMYSQADNTISTIEIPTLSQPDIEFIDVSAGCGGFVDCLEYIGAILYNVAAGVIFMILFIINLLVFLFKLIGLLLDVSFTGIEGAPWQFNTMIIALSGILTALIVYRSVRSGQTSD